VKLSMLSIVQRTTDARERLLRDIAAVELGAVRLAISGVEQDDALSAAVSPIVLEQLHLRVRSLELDLQAYGVEVD